MIFIILAGGLGTRLRTVVADVPKPLAPINGTPFLEHLLQYLLRFKPEKFVLCVSYMHEKIIEHIGASFHDVSVAYSIEEMPLGTGGAIRKGCLENKVTRGVVVNGDTFIEADYNNFMLECASAPIAVLLTKVSNASRYGKVSIGNGRIMSFEEKKDNAGPGLINAGSYIVSSALLAGLPESFSFEVDFLVPNIEELKPAYYISDGAFIDIGTPESYSLASRMFFAKPYLSIIQ